MSQELQEEPENRYQLNLQAPIICFAEQYSRRRLYVIENVCYSIYIYMNIEYCFNVHDFIKLHFAVFTCIRLCHFKKNNYMYLHISHTYAHLVHVRI